MPKSTPESFDVFISYSHADANWVFEWLIPRLSNVGLNVATERDFGVGTPELVNVDQIVDASRHVLLVLTPAWVRDGWANFGALLAQHGDPAGQRPRVSAGSAGALRTSRPHSHPHESRFHWFGRR